MIPSWLIAITIAFGIALNGLIATASTPPPSSRLASIERDAEHLALAPYLTLLEDPTQQLTLRDVMDSLGTNQFVATDGTEPKIGITPSAYWARIDILNTSGRENWFLDHDNAQTRYIDVWVVSDGTALEHHQGGTLRPTSLRNVESLTQTFKVRIPNDAPSTLYVRIQSDYVATFKLHLHTRDSLANKQATMNTLHGIYIGIIISLLAYNTFVYIALREKTYIYYIILIIALTFFNTALNGQLQFYATPDHPQLGNMLMIGSISSAPALFGLFISSFLRDNSPLGRYTTWLCVVLGVVSLIVGFFSVAVWTGMCAITAALVLTVYTSIILKRIAKRDMAAIYLMTGVSWFIAGAFSMILGLFAIIEFQALGPELGTCLEAILLSVALAQRMRNLKDEKENAQSEAIANLHKADRLKDEFLANTSHELRTPLNGMIGLAEAILADSTFEAHAEHKRYLGMIVASGKRLTHLVNDILDISKMRENQLVIAAGSVDVSSTCDVVLTLLEPIAQDRKLGLVNVISPDTPPVWADEARLQQILHNLVGNALKFTHEGSITISARADTHGVTISVIDTGIGIPAHRLESIFDAFNQGDGSISREYGGTGLGLSVARQLVRLHGGELRVTSREGAGSCFSFNLPLVSQGNTDNVPATSSPTFQHLSGTAPLWPATPHHDIPKGVVDIQAAPSSETLDERRHAETLLVTPVMPGARILIVDDEPVNREVLKAQLAVAGYHTEQAANGAEALGILLDAQREKVDLVLLDVMMPKLSGFEVCRSLRQKLSPEDLPILFLTAKVQGEDIVTGLSAGGNDYLTKPFSRDVLLARIQVHLGLLNAHRTLKQQHEELESVHKQLVQQEKMAQLGLLSAGVAHEINNPNNFLSISAQTVEQRLQELKSFIDGLMEDEADPELRESFQSRFTALFSQLSLVKDGSSRIANIVKSMRAASRNDTGESRPFDPADGLLATVQLVSSTWKQKVHFDTQGVTGGSEVMGHASQLNQVFTNLMVNACHAIEEKQTASGDTTPGVITLSTCIEGGFIVIAIKDSGCGMPEHVRKRLFEPFFTTKGADRGTGLGMGICRAIIDEHSGRIDVDSTAGVGTTFKVCLPIMQPFHRNPT